MDCFDIYCRGSIIHSDITSLNIVLDGAFNARLIDFGLAREMKYGYDYTKITTLYPATFGYHKNEDLFVIAKKDDYRCFGIGKFDIQATLGKELQSK